MAITFHLRGDSLTAYRGLNNTIGTQVYDPATTTAPAVVVDNTAGVFGSRLIQLANTSNIRGMQYLTGANFPNNGPMTIRARVVPRFTGNPATTAILVSAEGWGIWNSNIIWLQVDATGHLGLTIKDPTGVTYCNISSSVFSPACVSGTPIEFMAVWDGTANANSVRFSCNGVSVSQHTASLAAGIGWDANAHSYLGIGYSSRFPLTNFDINEIVIYNTAEAYVYTPNATFVTDTAFNGALYTDPGAAAVLSGTAYTQAGVAQTGALALPTAAAISAYILDSDNVETGLSLRHAVRLMLSAMAGKVSGAPTGPITIRDVNDTKDRIVATVDVNGNRLTLTYDKT